MELYKTVAGSARAEQVIKKSRFIVSIAPAGTREEAEACIDAVNREFRDATHNVPAMVTGENMEVQWASDNGEPQGTAGVPVLRVLTGEGLTNVVCVVTRYFGGIKLGTGSLSRAYSGMAKLGVEAAGVRVVREALEVRAQMEYTYFQRLRRAAEEAGYALSDTEYTDIVTVTVSADSEKADEMKKLLSDVTSGTAKTISERIKKS
ncbi:MAG: YigZ family protein [Anaerovoracaceae bacterium]|nr:YigZ family protein [Anaerovoracaceae bacterium]